MKNNISHYPHLVDSHNHWKFKTLRRKYKWEGEGKFWALNNMIASAENCQLDISDEVRKASVAVELDFDIPEFDEFVGFLINNCRLLRFDGSIITTEIVQETFGLVVEKRERDRERKVKSIVKRNNSHVNGDVSGVKTGVSGVENDHSIVEYSIVKESIVKDSKVNKKSKCVPIGTPRTPEEEKKFSEFQLWIQRYTPRVNQMKQPLTIDEYFKLRKKLSKEVLTKLLIAMQNRADLLKKNISTYLTILSWAQREPETVSANGRESINDKLKAAK